MHSIETQEIFHVGWSDPDWIRGFNVTIEPAVILDLSTFQDVMASREVEEIDETLKKLTFDDTSLMLSRKEMQLYAGTKHGHYGKPGSRMHERARLSLDARLGFLLREAGVEV